MKNEYKFIYTLTDPTNNHVRYVGISVDPNVRFQLHVSQAIHLHEMKALRLKTWIRSLAMKGQIPIIEIVEEGTHVTEATENHWKEVFAGPYLLNEDEEGHRRAGGRPSVNSERKLKNQNVGSKNVPAFAAKVEHKHVSV